ncbi:MAG: transposase [Sulfurovum sp.]|nr:transposase [Sulfurovum sp.]
MGRALRQNTAGYYHLVNRGVSLREVFLNREDRIYFIELICNYAKEYAYVLHGYALIPNGYNMLIETKKENLSNIMKLINAQYSRYYNKKYGRRGYLWEGRFKSWHIEDEALVLDIVAYIEYLPIYIGYIKEKERSYYTCYRQFVGIDNRLTCILDSIVFKNFNSVSEIKDFLNKPIDIGYINTIHETLRKNHEQKNVQKNTSLPTLTKESFSSLSTIERNKKIHKLYHEGYSQAKIAYVLGISQQAVHKIIKKISSS